MSTSDNHEFIKHESINHDFFKDKQPQTVIMADILSVDDKPQNLMAVESVLEELGQNIVSKNSGNDALKYLLLNEVAVILLDVRMPNLSGLETAALIRQRKLSRDTPIIFITAENPTRQEIAEAYQLGAVDYIFKPIVPEILKSKVKVFIDLFKKTRALARFTQEKQWLNQWQSSDHNNTQKKQSAVREFAPAIFKELQTEYESLLDIYLEASGFGRAPPRTRIFELAKRICKLEGGPRDVIDIHLRAVTHKCQNVHPRRENAYALEGRLLALELMGFLVDFYRRPFNPLAEQSSKNETREPQPETEPQKNHKKNETSANKSASVNNQTIKGK